MKERVWNSWYIERNPGKRPVLRHKCHNAYGDWASEMIDEQWYCNFCFAKAPVEMCDAALMCQCENRAIFTKMIKRYWEDQK